MKLNKKLDLKNFDYITYNNCAFCNSSDVKKIIELVASPKVDYYYCNTCKVSYTNKQLDVKSTENLYLNYYDTHFLKTGIKPELLGEHLFNFFSKIKITSSNLRILDYGGGDGSIAKHLGEQLKDKGSCENYTVDVFDVYECEKKIIGINYIKKEEEIKGSTYDIIIASAVLEHLNDPMTKLQIMFEALKPNGYFYARTPFRLPLKLLFLKFKSKRMGMQFPWHLFDMGRLFWNNLPLLFLNKNGMVINVVRSQPSLVQINFSENPRKYLFSKLLKLPGYIFNKWNYVGGWEVYIKKIEPKNFQ